MITIAREGLEDKYSLRLNPGGGWGLGLGEEQSLGQPGDSPWEKWGVGAVSEGGGRMSPWAVPFWEREPERPGAFGIPDEGRIPTA